MANIASQKKRNQRTQREWLENRRLTSAVKTHFRRLEAAAESGDRDSAIALVGVVAPTTNTAVPSGETKTYRMRMELRKVSDAWKVEHLEFVG